jgi:hypothetical protein
MVCAARIPSAPPVMERSSGSTSAETSRRPRAAPSAMRSPYSRARARQQQIHQVGAHDQQQQQQQNRGEQHRQARTDL